MSVKDSDIPNKYHLFLLLMLDIGNNTSIELFPIIKKRRETKSIKYIDIHMGIIE